MKDSIKINLDKPRRLKYTVDSWKKLLKKLRIPKTAGELVEKKLDQLDQKFLLTILWTGLLWEDPELILNDVRNILRPLDDKERRRVVSKIKEALYLYYKKTILANKEAQKILREARELEKRASGLIGNI